MADSQLGYSWCPYSLEFKFEARTSRAVMQVKDTYFIRTTDGIISEVPLFKGLSAEDNDGFESRLSLACASNTPGTDSSIRFGFEALERRSRGSFQNNLFMKGMQGIPINGLVWMGDKMTMKSRIADKLNSGFKVLKLKIGGINFEDELDLLSDIRRGFSPNDLEIRLDANGSFSPGNALERLERLSEFSIHSLEQPIKAGQEAIMADICKLSPIPIALDEELIGTRSREESFALIEKIKPQYLILKPALCGGFSGADTYIDIACQLDISWWATSSLESNIGLFDIALWLSDHGIDMPQGLGTGQLYFNNIPSPLELRGAELFYNPDAAWVWPEQLSWRR